MAKEENEGKLDCDWLSGCVPVFAVLPKSWCWLLFALAGVEAFASQGLQAQVLYGKPVEVRLHRQAIDNGPTEKLGIYVSIGDSSTPTLFEFDTGGSGFFAAYSRNGESTWWGNSGWSSSQTPVSNKYGSGLEYQGFAASGTVNLFENALTTTPKLQVNGVELAQTTKILDSKKNERLWPLPSQSSLCPNKPSTECAFWGDFGMALKAGKNDSVDSLIRQAAFWTSFDMSVITPGYRVRAAGPEPSIQFGLGADDLRAEGSSFVLDLTTGQVSGGLTVTRGSLTYPSNGSPSTPLLFDTGAFPTIHAEACEQTSNPPDFPIALTRGQQCQNVVDGAEVVVSGLTTADNQLEPFWAFQSGQGPAQTNLALKVKNKTKDGYYLNTGLLPFETFDIIFNLDPSKPQVTLVPVPAPAPLLGAAGLLGFARRLRRRIRQR